MSTSCTVVPSTVAVAPAAFAAERIVGDAPHERPPPKALREGALEHYHPRQGLERGVEGGHRVGVAVGLDRTFEAEQGCQLGQPLWRGDQDDVSGHGSV